MVGSMRSMLAPSPERSMASRAAIEACPVRGNCTSGSPPVPPVANTVTRGRSGAGPAAPAAPAAPGEPGEPAGPAGPAGPVGGAGVRGGVGVGESGGPPVEGLRQDGGLVRGQGGPQAGHAVCAGADAGPALAAGVLAASAEAVGVDAGDDLVGHLPHRPVAG